MFDPDRHEAPCLKLARPRAPLPPGLTESAVTATFAAISARLDDPEATARDVIITAFLALSGAVAAPEA